MSAYSSYAVNLINQEDFGCTMTIYKYNDAGQLMTIIPDVPCDANPGDYLIKHLIKCLF